MKFANIFMDFLFFMTYCMNTLFFWMNRSFI